MAGGRGVKVKLFYGVLVVVPLVLCVVLISYLVEKLGKLTTILGLESWLSTTVLLFLVVFGLLITCYLVGSLVQTRLGMWSFEKFETYLLTQVPGYRIIKNVVMGVSGNSVKQNKPAVVNIGPDGVEVLGFVMEENDNGTLTVFVPTSPVITVGNIYILEPSRVRFLQIGHFDTIACISEWGVGSSEILANIDSP